MFSSEDLLSATLNPKIMAFKETKDMQISTDEKPTPEATYSDDSDRDLQESRSTRDKGTFDASVGHHLYRPIDSYEGIHRWDPEFEWTENEEKRIVRKVRSLILPIVIIHFLPLDID